MAQGRSTTILRLGKPLVAGLALAYLVTAFVDKPAPVHFQPDNPYAAQQSAIVEPEVNLVVEKNIMKLGSPLSVTPDKGAPADNPLAVLEKMDREEGSNATAGDAPVPVVAVNATVESSPDPAESVTPGASTQVGTPVDAPAVRKEVDSVPIPAPAAP